MEDRSRNFGRLIQGRDRIMVNQLLRAPEPITRTSSSLLPGYIGVIKGIDAKTRAGKVRISRGSRSLGFHLLQIHPYLEIIA